MEQTHTSVFSLQNVTKSTPRVYDPYGHEILRNDAF